MSENEGIKQQFLGPSCLYKVLQNRFDENPFMLRRNLRTVKDKRRRCKKIKSVSITTSFHNVVDNSIVSFFLLGKKQYEPTLIPYTMLKNQTFPCIPSNGMITTNSQTFQFNKDLLRNDAFISLCLLIVKSRGTDKDDLKTALAISKQLGTFNWKQHPNQEDVNILLKRPDVSICLMDMLSLCGGRLFGMRNEKKHKVPFRSFMQPPFYQTLQETSSSIVYYRNHRDESVRKVMATFDCTITFSSQPVPLLPPAPTSSSTTINTANTTNTNIALTSTTQPTTTSALNTYNLRPVPPLPTVLEEKLIHYHFVANDPQDAKSSYMEFYSTKYLLPQCIWCGYQITSRKKLWYNTETNKFTVPSAKTMAILLHHLQCCHDHFHYDIDLDLLRHMHITVRRLRTPEKYNAQEHRQSALLVAGKGGNKCIPYRKFEILEFGGKSTANGGGSGGGMNGLSPIGNGQYNGSTSKKGTGNGSSSSNGNIQSKYTSKKLPKHQQQQHQQLQEFFHPQTGQKLTLEEMIALNHMVDDSFEIKLQHQILDEFTDITAQEKEMMKLWNSHLATFPTYGDRLFPLICERFVQRYANIIVTNNLRHNLLLHLLNLWDFGLLLSEEVYGYMQTVDDYAYQYQQQQQQKGVAITSSSSSKKQ